MRSFIIIVVMVMLLGLTYLIIKPRTPDIPENTPTSSFTSFTPQLTISESESAKPKGIQSSWVVVRDMDKLSLHSNLVDNMSVYEAKEKWGCKYIINGGFFGEDRKHIGLFVEDGTVLSKEKQSSLFNGFISMADGNAYITQNALPNAVNAVQTGPMLIKDSRALKITSNEEKARRMVAAVSQTGDVIFIALYNNSSLVSGPTLSELPNILKEIEKNSSLEIKDAINLDGGAHSAFISDEVQLTDIQTPGSYFCIQP
jgi:uncharacterized protein YigE (DUF2233 family)